MIRLDLFQAVHDATWPADFDQIGEPALAQAKMHPKIMGRAQKENALLIKFFLEQNLTQQERRVCICPGCESRRISGAPPPPSDLTGPVRGSTSYKNPLSQNKSTLPGGVGKEP